MTDFNRGYLCQKCGPIPKADSKGKRKTCPRCFYPVNEWEKPMNERPGRCRNCAGGSFKQAMGKGNLRGILLVQCKDCGQVVNPDTQEVLREGRMKDVV